MRMSVIINDRVERIMITLTKRAADEIRKMQADLGAEGKGFRVEITKGGCQGYSYEFGFDEQKEEDHKSECHGIAVLATDDVAVAADGMTIDYVSEMSGEMFVFNNPKAASVCGCGNSFAI